VWFLLRCSGFLKIRELLENQLAVSGHKLAAPLKEAAATELFDYTAGNRSVVDVLADVSQAPTAKAARGQDG
jgi:hypothetical protein